MSKIILTTIITMVLVATVFFFIGFNVGKIETEKKYEPTRELIQQLKDILIPPEKPKAK